MRATPPPPAPAENPYSIDIRLAEHRLVVTEGGEVVVDEAIGVGTQSTPTPGGKYYLKELLQPPDPNGAYGPYAYGLSGHHAVRCAPWECRPGRIGRGRRVSR